MTKMGVVVSQAMANNQSKSDALRYQEGNGYLNDRRLESFGHLLADYVLHGAELTIDSVDKQTIHVSEGVISFSDQLWRAFLSSFRANVANTTYYIGFVIEQGYVFGPTEPTDRYMRLWTIKTDLTGKLGTPTDYRDSVGKVKFKAGYDGIYLNTEEVQAAIDDAIAATLGVEEVLENIDSALGKINNALGLADDAVASATVATTRADQAVVNANAAVVNANNAKNSADTAVINVNVAKTNAETATAAANIAKDNASTAATAANTAKDNTVTATTNANTATVAANTAKTNADTATTNATTATGAATAAASAANLAKTGADTAASAANTAKDNAVTATTNANSATTAANTARDMANTAAGKADTATAAANVAKSAADTATTNANTATTGANAAKIAAETATTGANTARANAITATTNADAATAAANTAKTNADTATSSANTAASAANTAKSAADTAATNANTATTAANAVVNNTKFVNAYAGGTSYLKNNVVSYQGSSYIALVTTIGNAPPTLPTIQNTWWALLAGKGTDGMGSVSKVNNVSPDINGNVTIPTSQEDYTTSDKNKLAGVAIGATNYTHPATHLPSVILQDASNRFMTDTERTKLTGIATGANNYTHPATHPPGVILQDANNRFMTDTERTKLTGIATGANNYVHPANHPATLIVEDVNRRFISDAKLAEFNGILSASKAYTDAKSQTINADDFPGLQAAIDHAAANSKKVVLCSEIWYTINAPIIIKEGIELRAGANTKFEVNGNIRVFELQAGASITGGTVLINSAAFTSAVIYLDGKYKYALSQTKTTVKDMVLINWSGTNGGDGLSLFSGADGDQIQYVNFENITISRFAKGIHLKATKTGAGTPWVNANRFDKVTIDYCTEVIVLDSGIFPQGECSANSFTNLQIQPGSATVKILTVSGSGNQFQGTCWDLHEILHNDPVVIFNVESSRSVLDVMFLPSSRMINKGDASNNKRILRDTDIGGPWGIAELNGAGRLPFSQTSQEVINELDTKISSAEVNVPWGIAGLDADGKIPIPRVPQSLIDTIFSKVDSGTVNVPSGVAGLDANGRILYTQVPQSIIDGIDGKINISEYNVAWGVSQLDANAKILQSQIPQFLLDAIEARIEKSLIGKAWGVPELDGAGRGLVSQTPQPVLDSMTALSTHTTNTAIHRNITISTLEPTGGNDGDIWLKY